MKVQFSQTISHIKHYKASRLLKTGRDLISFIMFSKVKKQLRFLVGSEGATDDLVSLITHLIHNAGLSSYLTILKVHWLANFSTFCFMITWIFQFIALFMPKDDPERLFECFSVLSFCSMGVLKLISLRRSHKNWRKLLTQISFLESRQLSKEPISHAEYQSDSEECDNFSDSIKTYTNKFRNTATIQTRIYSFTAVIFIMSPFVEHLLCKIRGMECLGYPHILTVWAVLDDFSIFGYIVSVLCEIVSAVYCVCVHIAFDLTAIGIMIFGCGQFSMLRDYSSRIGGKGRRCNLSKRRDDRAHFRIVQCHDTNNLLVNSITELDKLLSGIIGAYFFFATLTLCSVAVRLKSVSNWIHNVLPSSLVPTDRGAPLPGAFACNEDMSIMQLVLLTQYMCATLTQLFLFCLYADAVLNESSMGMGQGPFAAASWCLSPRVRRDLVLLSTGMIVPKHLHAAPFNFLDLPSFIQVVRAAYSYYAVLGKKE